VRKLLECSAPVNRSGIDVSVRHWLDALVRSRVGLRSRPSLALLQRFCRYPHRNAATWVSTKTLRTQACGRRDGGTVSRASTLLSSSPEPASPQFPRRLMMMNDSLTKALRPFPRWKTLRDDRERGRGTGDRRVRARPQLVPGIEPPGSYRSSTKPRSQRVPRRAAALWT